MKIKNSEVLSTIGAINKISELKRASKAIFALIKNSNKLKPLIEDYEQSHKQLIKEYFGEEVLVKNDDTRIPKFNKAELELLAIEVEFEPYKFDYADLNLNENAIAPAQLSIISWLINDFDTKIT